MDTNKHQFTHFHKIQTIYIELHILVRSISLPGYNHMLQAKGLK